MQAREFPSQETLMVAVPLPTAVTLPLPSTVATLVLDELQLSAPVSPDSVS